MGEEVLQAGCVAFSGDDVLLRRTAKGEWVFPKGHVEPGETPEAAAVREVAEETGLAVAVDRPAGEESFTLGGERRRVLYFLSRVTGELPSWPEHRQRDAFLVPAATVRELLTFGNSRRVWDGIGVYYDKER